MHLSLHVPLGIYIEPANNFSILLPASGLPHVFSMAIDMGSSRRISILPLRLLCHFSMSTAFIIRPSKSALRTLSCWAALILIASAWGDRSKARTRCVSSQIECWGFIQAIHSPSEDFIPVFVGFELGVFKGHQDVVYDECHPHIADRRCLRRQ